MPKTKKVLPKTVCLFCKKYRDAELIKNQKLIKKMENEPNLSDNQKLIIANWKSANTVKNLVKDLNDTCKAKFCNIGCKNTIFEPGSKLSGFFAKKYKNIKTKKALLDLLEKERKALFGKKTNVLQDNFYKKLVGSDNLRKNGAISGCTQKLLPNEIF